MSEGAENTRLFFSLLPVTQELGMLVSHCFVLTEGMKDIFKLKKCSHGENQEPVQGTRIGGSEVVLLAWLQLAHGTGGF